MTVIDEIGVDESIPHTQFACDLQRCKGACCTMPGGLGAPLLESEIQEIEKAFPAIQKYLSEKHLTVLEETGFAEKVYDGFVTPCVDNRACAFVTYDGDVAKCSFEKAYLNGEIQWRKPISCHLFPIRVDRGRWISLRFESIAECEPALKRGSREQIGLVPFLKEPLTRAFGSQWYEELLKSTIRGNGSRKSTTRSEASER